MTDKLIGPRAASLPARQAADAFPVLDRGSLPEGRQPTVLSQIWDMVARRKWTLILGVLAVVAVASVLTYRMARTYSSTFTILVGSGPRNANLPNLDELTRADDIETEMRLITSRRIGEAVVEAGDLQVSVISPEGKRPTDVLPHFDATRDVVAGDLAIRPGTNGTVQIRTVDSDSLLATARPGEWYSGRGLRFQLPAELPDDGIVLDVIGFDGAVGTILSQITVGLVNNEAALISVSCGANTADRAKQVCDGVATSYVQLRNDLQRSDASHAAAFLEEQSKVVGGQLAQAEEDLRRYKESNQVLDPQGMAGREMSEFASFQARREGLEAERWALSGFISDLEKGEGSARYRDLAAFPTFINNPITADLVRNLTTYENQLHELKQRRTDENVDVVNLRQRIGELEGQLGQMARNYEIALTGQITSLDRIMGRSEGRMAEVPVMQMEVARLERQSQLLGELYNTLQQRLKEAQIAEAVELADVLVLDQPTLPKEPSSPNVNQNIALALFAGLLFGIGAALLQEFADTRLRRRDEVERETGLPVLAVIPSVKGRRFELGRQRAPLAASTESSRRLRDYYPVGGELVIEAFRSLGADLALLPDSSGWNPRTVAFTSPSRGEGKTFSAVNFAATRALEGYRTLLIDGDLRAGSAGAGLGVGRGAGLSEVLSGEMGLLDAVQMVKVGEHRMAVLGAGRLVPDPGRLLTAERLEAVLAEAVESFDQVVIDTPPMNLVSDAALFAARADAAVVVVRAGQTDREALDLTVGRLGRMGAKTIGIALNDVKPADAYGRSRAPYAAMATGTEG